MVAFHARDGIGRRVVNPWLSCRRSGRLTFQRPVGRYRLAMFKPVRRGVGRRPERRRPAPGPRGPADAVLAVLLTLLAQIELLLADVVEGPMLLHSLAFMAMTASVAWRRSFPLLAAALAAAGLASQTIGGDAEVVGGFLALIIVTYSVASYAPLKPAIVGGTLIMAAVFVYPFLRKVSFVDEVGNAAIFVGAWALGRMVRSRQRRALHAQARLETAERDHVGADTTLVADERARIARELHDIVAHGVSLMVLQCGAARQTAPARPQHGKGPPRQRGGAGSSGARRAATDARHPASHGSSGDGRGPSRSPLLTQLVDALRATGLRVDYRVEGDQRPLAAGLELSAHRIVQEATTNIVKHADAHRAEITIRYEPDRLEL